MSDEHPQCIEINCVHSHRFRGSQASILVNYCTELIKTQFSLLVSLNFGLLLFAMKR